ncbi:ribose 5-phosphate isomerase A [Archaeoglobus neptunius]|uniref:ribose 5-phosphate isomerase A n=1 Tax=Archaeoglobus neptunius TaxID=2798580 RepID=UPI001925FF29|nr:ribose 5-phosphate isomerase A [Archaeoglobus neptunius]
MVSGGKFNAAKLALEVVRDGMVLGIGSGSTVEIFLNLLGERIRREEMEIYGVPTSYQSYFTALRNGIKIVDLEYEPEVCIDGADQVDAKMNCIKGGGGALTREKIVASASKKVVIIVDESKLVEKLSMPVPVEVLPFGYPYVVKKLHDMGCSEIRLRHGSGKVGPVITDNGNFVLDCNFGVLEDERVERLEEKIKTVRGVLENGIFPKKIIDRVIVGKG